MTMRDDVPDEIVDRHREDMLCPSAAAVTSLNVESAIWLSRWSSTDCGGDQQGGGKSASLLRCSLAGAEQLHAL